MSKTVWVVDAAYLFKASPAPFDYLKLKTELESCSGGEFFESYYLNSTSNPPSDAQDSFHNWLKSAPPRGPKMRVKLYPVKSLHLECPRCRERFERGVQKGVDVGIATLIVRLAAQNQYDRLVLTAGDGDLEDAIAFVKGDLHKEVWLNGYQSSLSADLQCYADRVVWLDEIWEKFRRTSVEKGVSVSKPGP